jgi:4-amino-4-deoxy-L-arabinose transferase-like glycosyltransferase
MIAQNVAGPVMPGGSADAEHAERRAADRAVLAIILIATGVRLAFSAALGLGIDESYMVAAGRTLAWSYFDHPPISWWLARGAALAAFSEHPFVVRLPFVLLFAGTTWMVYRLTALLFRPRAGVWAAAALSLAPMLGVTSATWVLPDGPLDFALAGFALAAAHALRPAFARPLAWWLVAGAFAGLAVMSKYTAVLVLAGLPIFLATSPAHRRWLLRPHPWLALAVAVAVSAPLLLWTWQHGLASIGFQGGRAAVETLRPWGPLAVLGGAALFLLPWIWAGLALALWGALRRGPADPAGWYLVCLALPPIVVFALVALWSDKLPLFHWAAPGYLLLFPLLGTFLDHRRTVAWLRPATVATVAMVLAALVVVSFEARTGALSRLVPALARTQPALQAVDWNELRDELRTRGLLGRPDLAVAALQWHVAGKVDFALGGALPVFCLCSDARQYGVVRPASDFIGEDVIIVLPPNSRRDPVVQFADVFSAIEPLSNVEVGPVGGDAARLRLFLGRDFRGLPASPGGGGLTAEAGVRR